jgi:hypothetical protein
LIEVGLHLGIVDVVILDRHVLGQKLLAVTFDVVAVELQILGRRTIMLAVPMHAGAADVVG